MLRMGVTESAVWDNRMSRFYFTFLANEQKISVTYNIKCGLM